jgi:hypothetical protein
MVAVSGADPIGNGQTQVRLSRVGTTDPRLLSAQGTRMRHLRHSLGEVFEKGSYN